eukprot:1107702-Rhodomonas_salina.1
MRPYAAEGQEISEICGNCAIAYGTHIHCRVNTGYRGAAWPRRLPDTAQHARRRAGAMPVAGFACTHG